MNKIWWCCELNIYDYDHRYWWDNFWNLFDSVLRWNAWIDRWNFNCIINFACSFVFAFISLSTRDDSFSAMENRKFSHFGDIYVIQYHRNGIFSPLIKYEALRSNYFAPHSKKSPCEEGHWIDKCENMRRNLPYKLRTYTQNWFIAGNLT